MFWGAQLNRWEEWKSFERQRTLWKMFDLVSTLIRLFVRGERNSISLSRKGNMFAHETKYGVGRVCDEF